MSLKIGVVGCGLFAEDVHGPSQKRYAELNKDVELTACCDIQAARAEGYQKKFGYKRYYTDMDKMFDQEKLDAVCLVTSVDRACPLALKIIQRRLPLWMEKPPGLTLEETKKLADAADMAKTKVQVGFNRRYTEVVRRAREIIARDFDPTKLRVHYRMIRCNRTNEDFSTTAIHAFDAALYLAGGGLSSGTFAYMDYPHLSKTAFSATAHLQCANGSLIEVAIDPAGGFDVERAEIHYGNRTVVVEFPVLGTKTGETAVSYWVERKEVETFKTNSDNSFYSEEKAFFDAVKEGKDLDPTLRGSFEAVLLMEAMRGKETDLGRLLKKI